VTSSVSRNDHGCLASSESAASLRILAAFVRPCPLKFGAIDAQFDTHHRRLPPYCRRVGSGIAVVRVCQFLSLCGVVTCYGSLAIAELGGVPILWGMTDPATQQKPSMLSTTLQVGRWSFRAGAVALFIAVVVASYGGSWRFVGLLGVLGMAGFAWGLVNIHAGTAEALRREREKQLDLGS
jgi:hypothetical protein